LTRDPQRRLGAGKADAEEIKRHAFFKDVNFDDVLNKRIPPPYFPTIVRAMSSRTLLTNLITFIRMEALTRAISMKNSRENSLPLRLYMVNCHLAIRQNLMASHGYDVSFNLVSFFLKLFA
jgi:hypothetical protein